MEYSPKKMNELLEEKGFHFKKCFGQNFIVDENIIRSMVTKSGVDKDTLVIEVGPGAGSLTTYLSAYAKHVICYEIDEKLKDILDIQLKDLKNVEVYYKDFLEASILDDIKDKSYDKLYVVSNLPYYITTPIIMKLIEDHIPVDKIVIMVQKEVGNRLKAIPGNKDYGSLSVYLNYYFDVHKLMDISKNVFMPKPNVDSIVVALNKKEKCHEVYHLSSFFKLIRDAFGQKRKTLRNNLKGYDLTIIDNVLSSYGYDLSVRAEQLSLKVFVDMANHLFPKD